MTLYERFEKLTDVDESPTTRGRLIGRAAKACLGVAVVAAGLGKAASAGASTAGAGCCVLAYQTQCGHCRGQGYDCGSGCTRWAWYCVDPSHRVWLCGECYAGGGCPGCSCGTVAIAQSSSQLEFTARDLKPR